MLIDTALLNKLAKLGGITLEDEELEMTKNHLSEIVNFVENINALNLEDIPASFNPLNSKLPMRQDIIESKPEIAKNVLEHAPSVEDNFFIVPKIIE
ncbi:Asp-tRNA(Asn)/Glu-tRNA(Gln) amidotransferase subunit GatC [Helicobacter sp.]|uniref:Asp-tRNA(Asn)/Glu-tRNA(Gln) amidotransferase subunit GatC n=1 Tax=Helicobacter sp. TaxID=218 RepID=UPI0025C44730|nr:Asp-tRNA(Asn)/Glu-tRNA(Gln) amidotransferase subunit GatC [Helicobacter sp.]MCI5969204.1 Asp-tRNA(Asn)/Glu-tRNA(Gln) amidotransferase subunit GatC [Helicobacter sp.]MDY2584946.1 Asp-tRNA(Asn)/Glu-tRNA(Gln) amidotransferase subunit GatC [Helicobacter sp.]